MESIAQRPAEVDAAAVRLNGTDARQGLDMTTTPQPHPSCRLVPRATGSDRFDRAHFDPGTAVRELSLIVTRGLPDLSSARDLDWVRDPRAPALYDWAVRTVGPDAALDAAREVIVRIARNANNANLELVVFRIRRDAARWSRCTSRAAARHERLVAEVSRTPMPSRFGAAPCASDPLTALPRWLEQATGLPLSTLGAERLVVCATIAVDLAASDDARRPSSSIPIAGVLRRRLADHLNPPLARPVARRAITRLLLGPTGRPDEGVLSTFGHRFSPTEIASRTRASWAADSLDLDDEMVVGRSRPAAREAARRQSARLISH